MSKYLEQYARMQRAYKKYEDLARNGREDDVPSVDYEDNIYAFFMHCHHLKDWIKNDVEVSKKCPNIENEVEETLINHNEYLRMSADICNAAKHLHLKKRCKSDPDLGWKKGYRLHHNAGQPVSYETWYIIREKKDPIGAFEVATNCVEAWCQFLVSKHLIKAP